MSIPASEIVAVTPGVLAAGGNALDMIGLILTTNAQVPMGTVEPFATEADVADYFGAGSAEAANAAIYFNGFDNSNKKPGSVLFAQYNTAAVAAYLRGGDVSGLTLNQLKALSGSVNVIIDGYAHNGSAIDLSSATSFSNAATLIATGINGALATIASFTGSLSGHTLTVSAVASGVLAVGQTIAGAGVTAAQITAILTGTGGVGTYTISGGTQTVSSEAMTTVPTPAVVTYDSTSGGFVISSGVTGAPSTIAFATGTIADNLLLRQVDGAVISQGAAIGVPATFMDSIVAASQDWAVFTLMFDPDLTGNAIKLAFAAWTSSKNNRYAFVVLDTDASPTVTVPASGSLGQLIKAAGYSGTCPIYAPTEDFTLPVFVCGTAASIDFDETNGRITFKFRSQAGLTPSVTDATVAANLTANGYNFYGAYATANDNFEFFAEGSVSGTFNWLDSFVNQIWLNNGLQLALLVLMTNAKSIPYSIDGYSLIEAACLDPINAALNFGAIRAGITLSAAQIAAVNAGAGVKIDRTLQNRGWYLQVKDAPPEVRQARGSPPCTFWYMDGESIQKLDLASINVQ